MYWVKGWICGFKDERNDSNVSGLLVRVLIWLFVWWCGCVFLCWIWWLSIKLIGVNGSGMCVVCEIFYVMFSDY